MGQRRGGGAEKKERKEKGTTAVMFYEMILFCSLAGLVGAIISLAETNTEEARNATGKSRGVPAAGVPHCHLVAPTPGSQNTRRGSAGSPCPPLHHRTWTRGPASFQCFTTKPDNCKTAWSIKNRCRKARGKGKNSTNRKFKANLSLLGKAGAYTEACRFPSSIAAAHKATAAFTCSAIVVRTPAAKWWAGGNSERYLVPRREAWI